jgi:cytochrome c-type biogenesis protein CcmH
MLLWFLFAAMTAGVLAALLFPLTRPVREAGSDGAGVRAVLRDQLEEIEAERARGVLADGEAAAARIEVSRRALANAAPLAAPTATPAAMPPRGPLAVAIAVAVPLLALAIYLACGSPEMASPGPKRSVSGLERADIGTLIAQVEARLRERPDDGRGWDVIAPIYLKLGRFRDAADAFARAARLEGETVRRLTGYAEATVLAADGRVVEEAQRAAEKILRLAPDNIEARYWLALGEEQGGKLAQALADYQALLKATPADAEDWRHALEERISGVAARVGGKPAAEGPPGPREEDVLAASKLSPSEREKLIAGMVDGLAERLKREGGDLTDWQRLINAYAVLGRDLDARRALEDARKRFAGDGHALAELAALAKNLGLGS